MSTGVVVVVVVVVGSKKENGCVRFVILAFSIFFYSKKTKQDINGDEFEIFLIKKKFNTVVPVCEVHWVPHGRFVAAFLSSEMVVRWEIA